MNDGSFSPNGQLTRGQAAKMIALAADLDHQGLSSPFSDVPGGHEFDGYIAALVKKGAIKGYSDGRFRMHDPITRQQIAQVVVKAFDLKRGPQDISFSDVSPVAAENVETLASHGIVSGYGDDFRPFAPAARAQFSKMLYLASYANGPPIGLTSSELIARMGTPLRIDHAGSEMWYTYHDNYQNYQLINLANGSVRGVYSAASNVLLKYDIKLGMTESEVNAKLAGINRNNPGDALEPYQLSFTYDSHNDNRLIGVLTQASGSSGSIYSYSDARLRAYERQIADLVNVTRLQQGLGTVAFSTSYSTVARNHSIDMVKRDYFGHDCPDGQGPGKRFRQAGLSPRGWSENIALGYRSAFDVHAGWMNSSGHRRIILGSNYNTIGVGLAAKNSYVYFTEVLAVR